VRRVAIGLLLLSTGVALADGRVEQLGKDRRALFEAFRTVLKDSTCKWRSDASATFDMGRVTQTLSWDAKYGIVTIAWHVKTYSHATQIGFGSGELLESPTINSDGREVSPGQRLSLVNRSKLFDMTLRAETIAEAWDPQDKETWLAVSPNDRTNSTWNAMSCISKLSSTFAEFVEAVDERDWTADQKALAERLSGEWNSNFASTPKCQYATKVTSIHRGSAEPPADGGDSVDTVTIDRTKRIIQVEFHRYQDEAERKKTVSIDFTRARAVSDYMDRPYRCAKDSLSADDCRITAEKIMGLAGSALAKPPTDLNTADAEWNALTCAETLAGGFQRYMEDAKAILSN
jgi:hypothetical protein